MKYKAYCINAYWATLKNCKMASTAALQVQVHEAWTPTPAIWYSPCGTPECKGGPAGGISLPEVFLHRESRQTENETIRLLLYSEFHANSNYQKAMEEYKKSI